MPKDNLMLSEKDCVAVLDHWTKVDLNSQAHDLIYGCCDSWF